MSTHAKKRNFGVKQLILQNVEGGNVQKEKRYYTLGSLSTTIFMEARTCMLPGPSTEMYGGAPQFHIHKGSD